MQKIIFSGKHIEVTEALKEYAKTKLNKLEKFFDHIQETHVTESIVRGQHIVEVTMRADSKVIRAEEKSGDMYQSIDLVVDKLERQLTKYKDRFITRKRESCNGHKPVEMGAPAEVTEETEDGMPVIVRSKKFSIKPMDPEEAAMEMELIGHDFYVFRNSESNDVNVIYKRQDGNYGLIEPIV
jgi:putative sigma-54 modulation protein